jgi:hypothetical protein
MGGGGFLRPRQLPDGGIEVSVDPQRFHDIYCVDVTRNVA